MSKRSLTIRNEKRKKIVVDKKEKRDALIAIIRSKNASYEDRFSAYRLLEKKLPRDSAKNRIRNRCFVTSRPRSVHRCLAMSRIVIRKYALSGLIPGLKKVNL